MFGSVVKRLLKINSRKHLWWIAAVLVTISILWFLRFTFLQMVGNFLVVGDEPCYADCLVILSGAYGERMEEAARLFHQGYSGVVIVTGADIYEGINESDILREHAIRLGISETSIIQDRVGWNTYTSAVNTLLIMEERGFRSAMVVSSPYHMRRVRLAFEREKKRFLEKKGWARDSIHFYYIPSEKSTFHVKVWWRYVKDIKTVFYEYTKLIFYFIGL